MAGSWISLARNAARGDLFHIIDTETTGSAPPSSRVIELACATLRHGEVVDRFETLIDPGVPIPPFITRLTGITSAMVRGQARPDDAMRAFAAYIAARPGHFVAHNASFDYNFLQAEFAAAELEWPFSGRYCTVRLSRHCNPQLARHNLDALIKHYGVVVKDRHRAMADVDATAIAFWRMVETLADGPGPRARPAVGPIGGVDAKGAARPALPAGGADAKGDTRPALPPGAWRAVIRAVAAESRTLAAMLEQHGALGEPEPDGAVPVALREPFFTKVDAAKLGVLQAAVCAVLGPAARARLVVPGGVAP